MRYLTLIFILLLLASCTHSPQILPPILKGRVQEHFVSPFTRVKVDGQMNVSLHTGYRYPEVILRGDPRDLEEVMIKSKNNSLVISLLEGYPRIGAVTVEIRAHDLKSFSYKGHGTIKGTNLHSGHLELCIDNPGDTTLGGAIILRKLNVSGGGTVQISGVTSPYLQLCIAGKTRVLLTGRINLPKLDLGDGARLNMYWVKSQALNICQRGRSFVELAGVVNKLDVELWDSAHFNGRYLRAKNAFVKTHDRAIADLVAIKHQHTLATDASDIYFYKVPDTEADFMAYAGSVLDMRDWNRSDLREYSRYNSPSSAQDKAAFDHRYVIASPLE